MITLFPWGLTVFFVMLLFIDRRRLLDGWSSQRWKPVKATIMDIRDDTSFMRTESQYRGSGVARLESRVYRYRYEVDGVMYESMRYSFEHEPREEMWLFESGQEITVFHDPADPRRAVIRRGLTWRSGWLPLLTVAALAWSVAETIHMRG